MSSYIPTDDTPYIPGFEEVTTRIIYGQWIDTTGAGITKAPTINYVNLPYFIIDRKVNVFGTNVAITATLLNPTEDGQPIPGTAGIWYAEVITQDPDLVGDVAVKINHSLLPGGSVTIAVPEGDTPLNIADAKLVVGGNGSMVAVVGPPGPAGPAGPAGEAGPGLSVKGSVADADALPDTAEPGDAYITDDDGHLYIWSENDSAFIDAGGFTGPAGPQGPTGATGSAGATGLKGDPGEAGPQGDKGDPGIQGVEGDPGAAGPKGDQGPQGVQGEQGPQGIQGTKGDQGDQGEAGTSIQMSGSVSDYNGLPTDLGPDDVNNTYVTEDNGHAWSWDGSQFIDLGPFRGPDGPEGPAGEQGEQGAAGPAGEKGDKGDQGDQGPQGVDGAQGVQGLQGDQGLQGEPGGVGPKGDKGDTGDTGEQGEAGISPIILQPDEELPDGTPAERVVFQIVSVVDPTIPDIAVLNDSRVVTSAARSTPYNTTSAIPAGVQVGDLILAVMTTQSDIGTLTTANPGWVISDASGVSGRRYLLAYYAVTDSAALDALGSSVTFNGAASPAGNRGALALWRVTGVDLANPILAKSSPTSVGGTATSFAFAAGTSPSGAGALFRVAQTNNSAATPSIYPLPTWPSGYTDVTAQDTAATATTISIMGWKVFTETAVPAENVNLSPASTSATTGFWFVLKKRTTA